MDLWMYKKRQGNIIRIKLTVVNNFNISKCYFFLSLLIYYLVLRHKAFYHFCIEIHSTCHVMTTIIRSQNTLKISTQCWLNIFLFIENNHRCYTMLVTAYEYGKMSWLVGYLHCIQSPVPNNDYNDAMRDAILRILKVTIFIFFSNVMWNNGLKFVKTIFAVSHLDCVSEWWFWLCM